MTAPREDTFVDRVTTFVVTRGGERVKEINETTKTAIEGAIRQTLADAAKETDEAGNAAIPGPAVLADRMTEAVGGLSVWDDARAETIARTETMFAYNDAALASYREYGVTQVQAIDGDEDAECAERDGQVFDLETALDIIDHPNGTLDWLPVIGDAADQTAYDEAKPTDLEQGYDFRTEQGGVVDRTTGETIIQNPGQGDSHSILLNSGERELLAKSTPEERLNMAFTHSHPSSQSFSVNDVIVGHDLGIGEMRAIGQRYVHSIGPESGVQWPSESAIRAAYDRADAAVNRELAEANNRFTETLGPLNHAIRDAGLEFSNTSNPLVARYQALIREESLAQTERIRQLDHEIWLRVAKDLGLRYRRYDR